MIEEIDESNLLAHDRLLNSFQNSMKNGHNIFNLLTRIYLYSFSLEIIF
jgi:hypothetical protein